MQQHMSGFCAGYVYEYIYTKARHTVKCISLSLVKGHVYFLFMITNPPHILYTAKVKNLREPSNYPSYIKKNKP